MSSDWTAIRAWQEATTTPLSPWEANAITRMGRAYSAAWQEYNGKDKPPPWSHGIDRDKVARDLRAALRR